MPEFLELIPPPDALERLLSHLESQPEAEEIESADALGRVTSDPQVASHPLPSFPRSTVDGYALLAKDSYGAGETLPAYLKLIEEVPMGSAADFSIAAAECATIHTGGMLPKGADAVVMIEHTQLSREGEVEILRAVAVGENVLKVGEDVLEGQEVIPAGTRLRPAEIGGLMALGITRINVAKRPMIGIISSGDEIVAPVSDLGPGQVRDVNAYTLSALVEQVGGTPRRYGIIPDSESTLRDCASTAMRECDAVVITAGSSASTRDLTAKVIDSLGEPGVLVHGVNVRPGKPTILAVCNNKVMIGLPGNPVSALVIASLFVTPVVEALQGLRRSIPQPGVPASLTLNLASKAGREDWVPVKLVPGSDGYMAEPIFGKSNLIFTLARADGLVRIPADATGLGMGEAVEVIYL